jgi:hypothetical protein
MSALGQKRTYAVQKAMSALPPTADMCGALRMSALCQWRTCVQALPALPLDNNELAHHASVLVLENMAVIHVWMVRVGKICKLGYDAHSRTRID